MGVTKERCECFDKHRAGAQCVCACHPFGVAWSAEQREQAENDWLRLEAIK